MKLKGLLKYTIDSDVIRYLLVNSVDLKYVLKNKNRAAIDFLSFSSESRSFESSKLETFFSSEGFSSCRSLSNLGTEIPSATRTR